MSPSPEETHEEADHLIILPTLPSLPSVDCLHCPGSAPASLLSCLTGNLDLMENPLPLHLGTVQMECVRALHPHSKLTPACSVLLGN